MGLSLIPLVLSCEVPPPRLIGTSDGSEYTPSQVNNVGHFLYSRFLLAKEI